MIDPRCSFSVQSKVLTQLALPPITFSSLPTMMLRAKTTRARCCPSNRSCVVRASQTDSAPAAKIEFGDLISIIKAVDTSDVVEMELKGKRFAMCVRKQEALQTPEPVYISAAAAPVAGAWPYFDSGLHPECRVGLSRFQRLGQKSKAYKSLGWHGCNAQTGKVCSGWMCAHSNTLRGLTRLLSKNSNGVQQQ